jgi:hypothetical protein
LFFAACKLPAEPAIAALKDLIAMLFTPIMIIPYD